MKLRYLLVALVLATTAACQSSPTAPAATPATVGSVRLDDAPAPDPVPDPADTDASRGGGAMGSGG
ncbi:MAG TPA: hypothetical protein VFR81_27650 [Longimicrobium sp.]|nr:hypothetical protein [Longimicrobium sp.]